MVTERQNNLFEFLITVEDGQYVSSKDVIFTLPCYRNMKPLKSAMSAVQADACALRRAYNRGEIDRFVVGRNTIGYKIGTRAETDTYANKQIYRLVKRIAEQRKTKQRNGSDGQITFELDGMQLTVTDVARKEN